MTHDKTTGLDPNVLGAESYAEALGSLDKLHSYVMCSVSWAHDDGSQFNEVCSLFNTIRAALQSKREEECVVWLSNDDAETVLFQAIQSIKFGNGTDDKMILKNLYEAGYWIANMPDKKDEKAS